MRKFLMAIVLLPLMTTAGEVGVMSVEACSRKGFVDIVVWIKGSVEDVAAVDCLFAATNSATHVALPMVHIVRNGDDTGSGSVWSRKFIWDAQADVGALKVDDVALTVKLKCSCGVQPKGVQLWENGPYWAERNVGAASAEDYGYYFSWGDVIGYKCKEKISADVFRNYFNVTWVSSLGVCMDADNSPFTYYNCPIYGKSNSQLQSEGCIDSMGNLTSAYDAATAHLGAPWRMPTKKEFVALCENCRTTWIMRNGVYGRLVTGKGSYSTKSIFLPDAGHGVGSSFYPGQTGSYWSSTSTTSADVSFDPWSLVFNSSDFYLSDEPDSYSGQSVRPVRDPVREVVIIESATTECMTTHFALDAQLPIARSYTETINDIAWTYTINNGNAQVGVGLSGSLAISIKSSGAITVPSVLGGCPVTSIGDYAVCGCSEITSVLIPSSVTNIGNCAFSNCSGLESVTFLSSDVSGGNDWFAGCDKLSVVYVPMGCVEDMKNALVDRVGRQVDDLIFCEMLSDGSYNDVYDGITWSFSVKNYHAAITGADPVSGSLTIPKRMGNCRVTRINDGAFSDCTELKSMTVPEGVTEIGSCAFYNCSGLTSVVVSTSVTYIGDYTFYGCSTLESIELPFVGSMRGNDESSAALFGHIFGRWMSSEIGGILQDYGSGSDCFNIPLSLKSVTITDETVIGYGAFYGCGGLTEVTIPASVTSIRSSAFSWCNGLKSVTLPPSVMSIGDKAFYGCSELRVVYVGKGDANRVKGLYDWDSRVIFVEVVFPIVEGDENAMVTGDAETGFVVKPSAANMAVEVTIPQGVDAAKVTVEVSSKVASVKPNGAKVKIVSGGADITEFLNVPAADGNGVVDLTKATVKEAIVKEVMDVEKGAKIVLDAADPKLTTAPTRVGLFYLLREGETLGAMKDGDSTIGDGQPWSPEITIKGGNSAFYSIGVGKGE